MKLLVVFLAVFAYGTAEEASPLIVGGVNAFPGEFPFIVSIQHIFLGKNSSHVEY
jgi:secreted trypsin-like serine protease